MSQDESVVPDRRGPNRPDESVELWDAKAAEWDAHVGADGDANRRLNSDPVLWRMLGDVRGLDVLDAGCGTGYLSAKLAQAGANVVAVDAAAGMVRIAGERLRALGLEPRVDDAQTLATVDDESVDRIVSNYVIMDLPDHEAAIAAMARVLRPGGEAVLVLLHPCFDAPKGVDLRDDGTVQYTWAKPYIKHFPFRDRWGAFTSDFITFHRPLRDYWRAFMASGFNVIDFDEPVVDINRQDVDPELVAHYRRAAFSVAFRLRKPCAESNATA